MRQKCQVTKCVFSIPPSPNWPKNAHMARLSGKLFFLEKISPRDAGPSSECTNRGENAKNYPKNVPFLAAKTENTKETQRDEKSRFSNYQVFFSGVPPTCSAWKHTYDKIERQTFFLKKISPWDPGRASEHPKWCRKWPKFEFLPHL